MFWYHLNFKEIRCPRRCPPLELTYHLQNRTYTKKKAAKSKRASEKTQIVNREADFNNIKTVRKKERKITQEHCYCFAPDEEEEDGAGRLISPYPLNGSKRHTCAHNYHENVDKIIPSSSIFSSQQISLSILARPVAT
jgi:ribosomal protein L14E/L6E/L27E